LPAACSANAGTAASVPAAQNSARMLRLAQAAGRRTARRSACRDLYADQFSAGQVVEHYRVTSH
jgi:hypothetical protein